MNSEPNPTSGPDELEPTAAQGGVPAWLFVLVAVMAFWGMGFLDHHGGGFQATVYPPYNSLAEVVIDQPSLGNDAFRKGQRVFVTYCQVCHQATGLGAPGQFPPLAGSEWVLAKEPGRVIRIVLNGLQGPIKVKDQAFDSASMIPWKDQLSDEEIANVLTFVRSNKEWANDAPPVTAEQVKAVRDKTRSRSSQWFVTDLLKVNENE